MKRNWQVIYDVLKVLINETFVRKEMFDFVHQYHLHLLQDIYAVEEKDNHYTFTWLAVEIIDVLESMKSDGIDLTSIESTHTRIVNCINPCIEKMKDKRMKHKSMI